ncbi:MAG: hypothetical protein GF350_17385 [Chitinivibrionales bacterium]|nr:hypothetical protein [Chitinivibrionales bacterium]
MPEQIIPTPGADEPASFLGLPEEEQPAKQPQQSGFVQKLQEAAKQGGGVGALAGAGLGALRAALAGEGGYLKNTLAGALLGGGIGTGTSYLAKTDPFTQGSPIAKAFEAAKAQVFGGAADPQKSTGEIAGQALMTGAGELLSGKHEFTPQEQKALVQQFVKTKTPSVRGWQRRINLANQAIKELQTNPVNAIDELQTLVRVAPDVEMRQYAGEALANIRSGRYTKPEQLNALAATAQQMGQRLRTYQQASGAVEALNRLKEQYGAGQVDQETLAKNLGLLTGRFGPETEKAKSMRSFLQEVLARPVSTHRPSPYPESAAAAPDVFSLIQKARG